MNVILITLINNEISQNTTKVIYLSAIRKVSCFNYVGCERPCCN